MFNAYYARPHNSYHAGDNDLKATLDRVLKNNFWENTLEKLVESAMEEKLSGLIERNDLRKLRLK